MDNKITELLQDVEFVKSLLELETKEDVQKAFAARGAVISLEDVEKLSQVLSKQAKGEELTEDELDMVVGGSFFGMVGNIVKGTTKALKDTSGNAEFASNMGKVVKNTFSKLGEWFTKW